MIDSPIDMPVATNAADTSLAPVEAEPAAPSRLLWKLLYLAACLGGGIAVALMPQGPA